MTSTPYSTRPTPLRVRLARGALAAIGGSAVLAVAAHVAVPFWPVPLTMQTLAVFALGVALGPVAGPAAVLLYVVEGLCGLPVFAHGAGPAALLGPTGGYLVGFVVGAAVVGQATARGLTRRPAAALLSFAVADLAIFACGVAWLATSIGATKAVAAGLTPFLLGEALKIALAIALAQTPLLRRIVR